MKLKNNLEHFKLLVYLEQHSSNHSASTVLFRESQARFSFATNALIFHHEGHREHEVFSFRCTKTKKESEFIMKSLRPCVKISWAFLGEKPIVNSFLRESAMEKTRTNDLKINRLKCIIEDPPKRYKGILYEIESVIKNFIY